MDWLREHYGEHRFFAERDIVWTVQKQILATIEDAQLPYRVFNDHTLSKKGVRPDLVILGGDSVEVIAEFKYEPSHSRSTKHGGDIRSTKFPVVPWTGKDGSAAKDVQRTREYVEQGKTKAAYSVFIDEGGEFRRRNPHSGSEWRDWGEGRWALWSQTSQRENGTPPAAVERSTQAASTVARSDSVAGGTRHGMTQGSETTTGWIPLPDWDPDSRELPITLRLPDGSERMLRYWNDLLPQIAAWLWTTEQLTNDNLPVPSGSTNYIVSDTSYHSTGRHFDFPKRVPGTSLMAETNTGNRKETEKFAEKLLKHCMVEPGSILVKN